MVDGSFIVNVVDEVVPDVGTLPVPVHPLHAYLVSTVSDTEDVTDTVVERPASIHPLAGVGVP